MTDIDETVYRAAVKEGKAIIAYIGGKQWALGDLAAEIAKVYGENRLEQFAEDINFPGEACTLARIRSVCLAFPKTGARALYFAAAKILQSHPDRIQIVTANPKISKRAARELMHKWRAAQQLDGDQAADIEDEEDTKRTPSATTSTANEQSAKAPNGAQTNGAKQTATAEQENIREHRGWFKQVVTLANEAIDAAEVRRCTPAQRRDLLAVVEPRLVEEVRKGGEALIALAAWLAEPLEEAAETEIKRGRVRTSPKPAPASVH